MSRNRNRKNPRNMQNHAREVTLDPFMEAAAAPQQPIGDIQSFTFGDPNPVLSQRDLLDCMECANNGQWYETPISFYGLARTLRAAVHHESAIMFKRNVIMSCFQPHPMLKRQAAESFILDQLVFGNSYLELVKNMLGRPLELRHVPAKYMRRGVDLDQYFLVTYSKPDHAFTPGSVFHLIEPDINQEIYGLPSYMAAIQSALLNEDATLFRRKYYINGSHAGVIVYLSDAIQNQSDVDALKRTLTDARGKGAFKNVFVYAAGGKKDGLQIMPFSEITAKDEFSGIKNVTRDDLLAAHRVPPVLMGIMPNTNGGFGDVEKAAKVFAINELAPLMSRLKGLNEWIGVDVFRFDPYALIEAAGGVPPRT